MYYHLFRNVLRLRWPKEAVWRLHPDEHTAMDWESVQDFLGRASTTVQYERSLFTGGSFRFRLRQEFGIEEVRAVHSGNHALLQLADLFAGLAVFSRERFDEYKEWSETQSAQAKLFDDVGNDEMSKPSGRSSERFRVLREVYVVSKQRKLGVSLVTKRGLWTPKPENPLNFWLYEPQHPLDKAPQRGRA